jgi:ketosteroid isomerase-like protein
VTFSDTAIPNPKRREFVKAVLLATSCILFATSAFGAEQEFAKAFNARDWATVEKILAPDPVFHRANAEEVFVGKDAILDHWKDTIAGKFNVKFVKLDPDTTVTGDGAKVERGDFMVTAGTGGEACYAGSYLATWSEDRLKVLTWQDVEVDPTECK